jgi:hypothetical protein
MANSKHEHVRYNILDYCFRNKSFTFNELSSFVIDKIAELYTVKGIAIRVLRDDIKVLRDKKEGFGAPLLENIKILRYIHPDFSIVQKLNKSYNMVNGYVQNRQQPRLEVLSEIAEIIDVDIKDLIVSIK